VKAWEQGNKKPSGTARRLLQLVEKNPEILIQI
jgi:DNA-binding transcriptional regulator YiaG